MTRRTWGISLCLLALTAGIGLALAREQTQGGGRSAAEQAWRAGDYERVESLAAAQANDSALGVLRARSAAAVGDYARAGSLLQPFVAKAPGGDAAVELGLLQTYQGKKAEALAAYQAAHKALDAKAEYRTLLEAKLTALGAAPEPAAAAASAAGSGK